MANELNYSTLIRSVITDFNSIWTALNQKGDLVLKHGQNNVADTPVATSLYGGLVDRLVYIDGLDADSVAHYNASTIANPLGKVTVVKDGSTFNLATTVQSAGYYATGAKLTGTIAATPVDVSQALSASKFTLNTEKTAYTYVAADHVVGTITMAKGTVTNDQSIIEGTFDAATGNATNAKVTTTIETLAVDTATGENKVTNILTDSSSTFKLKINASAKSSGTVSAKTVNTVNEGYVLATDKAETKYNSVEINSTDSESLTVGIKAGSITINSAAGGAAKATITDGANGIVKTSATGLANPYTISATITAPTLEATIGEGYVTSDSGISVGTLATEDGTVYVAHGTVPTQDVSISDKIQIGGGYFSASGKQVDVTIATNSVDKTFTEGYIKSSDVGDITVSGTKTVYITEAEAVAKYKIGSYATTGTTLPGMVEGDGKAYKIVVTPSVTVETGETKAGWIDGGSSISTGAAANNVSSITYSIDAATLTVSPTPTFEATVTDADGDYSAMGDLAKIGDLFLDAAPTKGDYFTVVSSVGYSNTAGYIAAGSGTSSVTKYMKKAVLAHVEGEDGEDYYEVTSGGYLPSGILSEISAVRPDMAIVNLNMSTASTGTNGNANIISTTRADGKSYYEISLSRSSVDAGYISAVNGQINATGLIVKGSAKAEPTMTSTSGSIARVTSGNTVKYTATSTVTANSNITVEEGYITAAEVQSANDKVSKTQDVVYEINRATFGTTTHTTNASITPTNVIAAGADETSNYTVTPKIDNCSTVFTVANAGYISNEDKDILKFEEVGTHNGTMAPFKIHAGTGITSKTPSSETVTIGSNFATASDNYKVTVGGVVTATIELDKGYYGTSESTLRNVTFDVSKELAIDKGAVSVVSSGTNSVTATDINLKAKETGKTQYAINATVTPTLTKSVTAAGYVKAETDITATSSAIESTVYVDAYLGNTRSDTDVAPQGTETFEKITIGQTDSYIIPDEAISGEVSLTLATAQRYAKKDTPVELSAHAMGSGVVNELVALQARLNGYIGA